MRPLPTSQIFPLGIGTWGIGGLFERDSDNNDTKQIDALAHSLNAGMNFIEVNQWYAGGKSAELIAKAFEVSGKKREELFICSVVYLKSDKNLEQSKPELRKTLEMFSTDYTDIIQTSMGSLDYDKEERILEWFDELLADGTSRFVGSTNHDLALLRKVHSRYQSKLFSQEVVYNFELRANEELGIIPYGQKHNIKTVAYLVFRNGRTLKRNWPLLVELADKYSASQAQIILAWILQKGYLALIKSDTVAHIDDNLKALELKLEQEDIDRIEAFSPDWDPIQIDWTKSGKGSDIVWWNYDFDEEYDRQQQKLVV